MKFYKKVIACLLVCALAVGTLMGVSAMAAGTLVDKSGQVAYGESRIASIAKEYDGNIYYSGKVYYDGEYVMDITQEKADFNIYVKNNVIGDDTYVFWCSDESASSYYIIENAKMAIKTNAYSMERISFPSEYEIEKYNAGSITCGVTTVDGVEYYSETAIDYQTDEYTTTNTYCFEKGTTNLVCIVYKTIYTADSEVVTTTYKLDELRHSSTSDWNVLLPAGFPNGYTVE